MLLLGSGKQNKQCLLLGKSQHLIRLSHIPGTSIASYLNSMFLPWSLYPLIRQRNCPPKEHQVLISSFITPAVLDSPYVSFRCQLISKATFPHVYRHRPYMFITTHIHSLKSLITLSQIIWLTSLTFLLECKPSGSAT